MQSEGSVWAPLLYVLPNTGGGGGAITLVLTVMVALRGDSDDKEVRGVTE
jgi:hypothetical protein